MKSYTGKGFKKIRIKKKQNIKPLNPELSQLINERNKLIMMTGNQEAEEKINILNEKVCEIEAFENREKIMKHFSSFSQDPEKINLQQMWKLNKKNSGQSVEMYYQWLRKTIKGNLSQIQEPSKNY